jgi:hypothetical protein
MTEPTPSRTADERDRGEREEAPHPDVMWTTPSQAEGERDDEVDAGHPDFLRTTPSQAEGERDQRAHPTGRQPRSPPRADGPVQSAATWPTRTRCGWSPTATDAVFAPVVKSIAVTWSAPLSEMTQDLPSPLTVAQ